MTWILDLRPAAELDAAGAAADYEREREGLGERFLGELDAALDRVLGSAKRLRESARDRVRLGVRFATLAQTGREPRRRAPPAQLRLTLRRS